MLNDVTWHKTNCKPESVRSRFGCDAEAIFVFAKSKRHYFAKQYEPYSPRTVQRIRQFREREEKFDPSRHKHDEDCPSQAPMCLLERIAKNLVVPGQVPTGCTSPAPTATTGTCSTGGAAASARCGPCPLRDTSGPFRRVAVRSATAADPGRLPAGRHRHRSVRGRGTSVVVAEDLDRTGIGIDINPEYLELARRNVLAAREEAPRQE